MTSISLTDNTLLQRLNDGTLIACSNKLDQATSYVLQEQGDWFEDEIKFLRNLVQPGQTIVDIGARNGIYALPLAKQVGSVGKVWAFEAAAEDASLLAQGIKANGTTWMRQEQYTIADTCSINSQTLDGQQGSKGIALITLDACLNMFGWINVDVLRIGTCSETERILLGGWQFFHQHSPLVMFKLRAGAELQLKLVKQFEVLGYSCFRLVPDLCLLAPFELEAGIDGFLINLFAAKTDQIAALHRNGWLVQTRDHAPPDPSKLVPYQWRIKLTHFPYSRALSKAWTTAEPFNGNEINREALALWAFCQDQTKQIQERFGALQRSYQLLCQLCHPDCPPTRWASLARVANALGQRLVAVRALGQLLPLLEENQAANLSEPFLAPHPNHDAIDPHDRVACWLEAAAWEADELISSFSGFYTGAEALPRLQRIKTLGFASPVAQRRLQLAQQRFPVPTSATPDMEHVSPDQIVRARQAWEWIENGQWELGKTALDQALIMGDFCSEALYYIGKCLFQLDETHQAITLLQRAVELSPGNPAYLLDLGVHLMDAGQAKAGQAVVQQAVFLYGFLAVSSDLKANDLANLGIAYDDLGDTDNALESLDRALVLEPQLTNARRRKASILNRIPGKRNEAIYIWEELLAEDSGDVSALLCVAGSKAEDGELEIARRLLDQALELAPDYLLTYMKLAWATSISGKTAMADHLRYLQIYWMLVKDRWPEGVSSGPVIYALPAHTDKVRIGILSAEVGEHVVGLFLEPFLRHYDRSRLEVELIQTQDISGGFADLLRAKGDAVLSVQNLNIPAARRRVRSRGYHLIMETSGLTRNTGIAILAKRCAPVQCHYIGFHASTGLDTIDWFIGDELTAAADLQDQYVEKLWRLPRPWLACHMDPNLPEASSVLRHEPPILGSFNQFSKVREETLTFWAAALQRVPEAVLHLKSFTAGSDAPLHRIRTRLSQAGLDPARVVFLPQSPSSRDSLDRYRAIDVALDATPWSGATTCFDALSMGVPVVGIRGEATASRMSSSILRGIGRENWIANTPDAFAAIVADLVSDLTRLRESRESMRQHVLASPLFDGADLAQHLQEALISMVRGEPQRPLPLRQPSAN